MVPTNLPLSALKATAPSSNQVRSSRAALARRDSPACRPPPACRLEKGTDDCSSPPAPKGAISYFICLEMFLLMMLPRNSYLKYLSCMVLIAHLAALGSNSSWNVSWLLISSWLAVTSTPEEKRSIDLNIYICHNNLCPHICWLPSEKIKGAVFAEGSLPCLEAINSSQVT